MLDCSESLPFGMPQERLLRFGAKELTNQELLAVFLRTGYRNRSVGQVAEEVLLRFPSLTQLFHASLDDFASIKGVGLTKFAQLQAFFELTKRYQKERLIRTVCFQSPEDVQSYLLMTLKGEDREKFLVLHLDAQHRVITSECLFSGSIDCAPVFPRVVVQSVLRNNSAAVILAHNHPSGVADASHSDIELTSRLKEALALIDVNILDHFIVAGSKVVSLARKGLI